MKTCTKCLVGKTIDHFPSEKKGKEGLSSQCRECHAARMRIWRKTPEGRESSRLASARHNAKPSRKAAMATYNRSEKHKAASDAWRQTEKGKQSLAAYRKSDNRKAVLKRHYEGGKGKATIARYQATPEGRASLARGVHKRRGLMRIQSTLTAQEWEAIKARAKNKCHYCRRRMERLTMDHVIPISKGGHHVASNIVPACRSCNSRKGNQVANLL